jgi:hypothetical protein
MRRGKITGFGHCAVGKNRFGKIPCIMAIIQAAACEELQIW